LLSLIQGVLDGDVAVPTALSTFIYGLVYPSPVVVGAGPTLATASLLAIVATPIVTALAQTLPPALAGPLVEAFGALGGVIVRALGVLPAPLPPFPAPTMMLTSNTFDAGARGIAPAVVDPFPDRDPGDVFDAVRGAAEGVLANAEALPAGVALIVKTIAARPELAPVLLAGAVNAQINGLQQALEPIAGALIGNLPRALRAPVGQALGQVNAAIDGFQAHLQDAVTPDAVAVKKQSVGIAGANQAAVEGPQDAPKKHRQRVELNVFKLNPLDQNNKDANGAAQVGSTGGTATTPKHGLGFGKTPVQDLVKRVLGGLTGNDNDDDGPAAGDDAPAAAAS
jgi:hypothetical protein